MTGVSIPAEPPAQDPLRPATASDAFAVKLDPQGSVVYSTYLRGSGGDVPSALALGAEGYVYVAGNTSSADFPSLSALELDMGAPVYKTSDGGASWRRGGVGLGDFQVTSLVIDPTTEPSTVYAVTPRRVQVSRDAGATWTNGGLDGTPLYALAIDPSRPRVLYAGGMGVYKSTDGGATWSASDRGIPGIKQIFALVVDPTSPSTLYAGAHNGVVKSTDGGANWSFSLGNCCESGFSSFMAIAVDPKNGSTVYAGGRSGLHKSVDRGATWTTSGSLPGPWRTVSALAIDPRNPSTVYAISDGRLFKSADGGGNWTLTDPTMGPFGFFCAPPTCGWGLALDPAAPSTIYLGGPSGIFKSTNGGETWSRTGLDDSPVSAIAIDPRDPATVYASARAQSKGFVVKMGPNGELVYSTYLGGAGADWATGIAVDRSGAAYVTGFTESPNFPVTVNLPGRPARARQTRSPEAEFRGAGFVVKLSDEY